MCVCGTCLFVNGKQVWKPYNTARKTVGNRSRSYLHIPLAQFRKHMLSVLLESLNHITINAHLVIFQSPHASLKEEVLSEKDNLYLLSMYYLPTFRSLGLGTVVWESKCCPLGLCGWAEVEFITFLDLLLIPMHTLRTSLPAVYNKSFEFKRQALLVVAHTKKHVSHHNFFIHHQNTISVP